MTDLELNNFISEIQANLNSMKATTLPDLHLLRLKEIRRISNRYIRRYV